MHNAKPDAGDESGCWVASLTDDGGYFIGGADATKECPTEVDSIDWCRKELRIRGGSPCIDLDDGSYIRTDLPRKRVRGG